VVSRGWSRGVRSALYPCFSSFGRYEVLVDYHKVVGSAQRRIGGVVLQHGSLLIGEGHLRIAQLLPLSDEVNKEKMLQDLREKTISLGALLSRQVSYAEVARALFRGFQQVLSSSLQPGELWPEERAMAQRLIRERYGRQEWTLRR
jgi:lipoate-protein ligase A